MSLDGRAYNMPSTTPPAYFRRAWILTDFAKLKKLLVSPVTMLDEPASGRFPNQGNENQHLLLCMEEWQLSGPELSRT